MCLFIVTCRLLLKAFHWFWDVWQLFSSLFVILSWESNHSAMLRLLLIYCSKGMHYCLPITNESCKFWCISEHYTGVCYFRPCFSMSVDNMTDDDVDLCFVFCGSYYMQHWCWLYIIRTLSQRCFKRGIWGLTFLSTLFKISFQSPFQERWDCSLWIRIRT